MEITAYPLLVCDIMKYDKRFMCGMIVLWDAINKTANAQMSAFRIKSHKLMNSPLYLAWLFVFVLHCFVCPMK